MIQERNYQGIDAGSVSSLSDRQKLERQVPSGLVKNAARYDVELDEHM